jgi:hypothetical protein
MGDLAYSAALAKSPEGPGLCVGAGASHDPDISPDPVGCVSGSGWSCLSSQEPLKSGTGPAPPRLSQCSLSQE